MSEISRIIRGCGLALLFPLALACATPSGPSVLELPTRVERPEQPSTYDVLVAELATREGKLDEARAAYLRAEAKDPSSAYLQLRLALLAAQRDEFEVALAYARRAVELEPDDDGARIFLGRLYGLRRDIAGAEGALLVENEAGERKPVSFTAAMMLARLYLKQGMAEPALAAARDALEFEPDALRAHIALANAFEIAGQDEEAEETLRHALRLHPGNLDLYSELLRRRRAKADQPGEIALYREILEERPGHYGTLTDLGEGLRAIGDKEAARDIYLELIERYPDDLPSVVRLAGIEADLGQSEAAAGRIEQVLAQHGDRPELALALGQLRRELRQWDSALEALERVPVDHARYFDARLQIASVLEAKRDYAAALVEIEELRTALPSRPLEFHTAGLRARTGDLAGAVSLLEAMLIEQPGDPEVLYQLGVVYGLAKRLDEAIGYMEQTLEQDGDNAEALNYLGYTWADRGERLDEAEAMITRAIELKPADGYIRDSLGWVYYQRARMLGAGEAQTAELLETALTHLGEAADLTGGDPVVSEHIGDVYRLLGDSSRALEYYLEAVALEPRFDEQPDLQRKIDELRGVQGAR